MINMSELKYKVTTIVPGNMLHQAIENTHNLKGMTYKVELYNEAEEAKANKPTCRTRGLEKSGTNNSIPSKEENE